MSVYNLFHVWPAAVAQFDCVAIEYFPQFMASWETFVDYVNKRFLYIGLDVSVECWITFLRLLFSLGGLCGIRLNLSL